MMILQLEDCIDCLQFFYPTFDFVFLFDHSNWHDRMQLNGLNIGMIRKYYGRKQPSMRPSHALNSNCFSKYHTDTYNLQPGMTWEV
jgi:hypothetical protein